ncbi:MAG: hypothetical protein P4L53_15825 [Candidatus Obscuribacterales bacterium]|nr:hypothetical protein [Candidatus Obscuribacterales bacterium]
MACAAEAGKLAEVNADNNVIASGISTGFEAIDFVGQIGLVALGEGMPPPPPPMCPVMDLIGGAPPGLMRMKALGALPLCAMGIGAPVGPPPPLPWRGPEGPQMILPFPPGVELRDDQIEKIARLKSTFMDKSDSVAARLRILVRNYRQSLLNSQLNTNELNKVHSEISDQKRALDDLLNQYMIEVHSVLTPNQRQEARLQMVRMQLGQVTKPGLSERIK